MMQYIGCHLTISGGFLSMGKQALALGGTTAQFFTRNPRGGKAKALVPEDVAARLFLIHVHTLPSTAGPPPDLRCRGAAVPRSPLPLR